MPIIDDVSLLPKTRVVIWEINESVNDLKSKVVLSNDSLKLLNQKKSEIHKKQFLAIRNIFNFLCIDEKDLRYAQSGKPIFLKKNKISISHSGNYAALIVSENNVGIDIEIINDKVLKLKSKFLETELNYPGKLSVETTLVYWNIKESIFKAVDKAGIDFKKNILVPPLNMNKNVAKSWYIDEDKIYSFDTHFKISKKYTLAYVIKN